MKITYILIALNVLAFLVSLTNFDYIVDNFGFNPERFLAGNYIILITSIFLHADLFHLASNAVAHFFLGWTVEKKVEAWQYLLTYFGAGIIGNLSFFFSIFGYQPGTVAVGASAAISGLVGLGVFMCPGSLVLFTSILPLPFALAGGVYFLVTLSNLFAPGFVAHSAHLFGFLSGTGLGFSWSENRMRRLIIFVALLLLIIFLPTIISLLLVLLT